MSSNIPPTYTDEEKYWIDHAAGYKAQARYYRHQDMIKYGLIGVFVLAVILLIVCVIFAVASCGQGVTVTYS